MGRRAESINLATDASHILCQTAKTHPHIWCHILLKEQPAVSRLIELPGYRPVSTACYFVFDCNITGSSPFFVTRGHEE